MVLLSNIGCQRFMQLQVFLYFQLLAQPRNVPAMTLNHEDSYLACEQLPVMQYTTKEIIKMPGKGKKPSTLPPPSVPEPGGEPVSFRLSP